MRSAKSVGRIVGMLLLLPFAADVTANLVLLWPVMSPPGFLANAAANSFEVRAAVLLFFAGTAGTVSIAIAAFPVFHRCSSAMALWLLALAVAVFVLQAVENAALLSMLSLSQEYAKAEAAKAELFQALAGVVGSARKWAHHTYTLVAHSWILLLYSLLYRFRLVPRALAAFGLVGGMVAITAIPLRGLWGYPPELRLAVPVATAYLVLAVWLMVKGFDERHLPLQAEAHGAEVAET